jgi:carbon storage regulator
MYGSAHNPFGNCDALDRQVAFALVFQAIYSRRFPMLVLTRRCGEKLVIADDIILTVVAVEGNKIRLGVDAPAWIRVDRQEVHNRRLADPAAGGPPPSSSWENSDAAPVAANAAHA